jgi:hypothetical protein
VSIALRTLLYKELLRFWKVGFQTVAAPVLTALLYLLVFSHVLDRHVEVYGGVAYTAFLVPGLIMMSLLQNAFAKQFVVADPVQGDGKHRVRAAVARFLPRILRRLCAGGSDTGAGGGCRRVGRDLVVRRSAVCPSALDIVFCSDGRRHAGQPRPHRRYMGRQVRSVGGVPEFRCSATHLPVGCVLLDTLPARVLAGGIACKPVFST